MDNFAGSLGEPVQPSDSVRFEVGATFMLVAWRSDGAVRDCLGFLQLTELDDGNPVFRPVGVLRLRGAEPPSPDRVAFLRVATQLLELEDHISGS